MSSCKFGLNDHKPFLKDHDHHHNHDHSGADKKVLKLALSITLITMFLEFFYGFLSNSLALISDAIHMFTHSFALIISLVAIIIASKQAPLSKTFGYYRVEVLAAFINGITIILSIFWILYEAVERFLDRYQNGSYRSFNWANCKYHYWLKLLKKRSPFHCEKSFPLYTIKELGAIDGI